MAETIDDIELNITPPTVTINPDGTQTITHASGETATVEDPEKVMAERQVASTRGAALIAELRSRRTALIEKHTINGVDWFLLRMDEERRNTVAEYTARHGDGSLRLDRPPVMKAFKRAVIQVGTVQGERDITPLFNPAPYVMDDALGNPVVTTEVEQFVAEPDAPIEQLFDLLTDINPSLWEGKKKIQALEKMIVNGETITPESVAFLG